MARKATTRVAIRRTGYAVIKYGRVQFFHKDSQMIDAFLSAFDPEFAACRAKRRAAMHARVASRAAESFTA